MAMVVTSEWVEKVTGDLVDDFCLYDDYNWDWTLAHLSNEIIKPATTKAWSAAGNYFLEFLHLYQFASAVHGSISAPRYNWVWCALSKGWV